MKGHLIAATAVALYIYNVPCAERCKRIVQHCKKNDIPCMGMLDLIEILYYRSHLWATELPAELAAVYLQQAMERYALEAAERVEINLKGFEWPTPN